jgi:hypothetical protein
MTDEAMSPLRQRMIEDMTRSGSIHHDQITLAATFQCCASASPALDWQ